VQRRQVGPRRRDMGRRSVHDNADQNVNRDENASLAEKGSDEAHVCSPLLWDAHAGLCRGAEDSAGRERLPAAAAPDRYLGRQRKAPPSGKPVSTR